MGQTAGFSRRGILSAALVLLGLGAAGAQTVTRVKDARAGTDGSAPALFRFAGGTMYFFAAQSAADGMQLWKSDGTPAGTALVK